MGRNIVQTPINGTQVGDVISNASSEVFISDDRGQFIQAGYDTNKIAQFDSSLVTGNNSTTTFQTLLQFDANLLTVNIGPSGVNGSGFLGQSRFSELNTGNHFFTIVNSDNGAGTVTPSLEQFTCSSPYDVRGSVNANLSFTLDGVPAYVLLNNTETEFYVTYLDTNDIGVYTLNTAGSLSGGATLVSKQPHPQLDPIGIAPKSMHFSPDGSKLIAFSDNSAVYQCHLSTPYDIFSITEVYDHTLLNVPTSQVFGTFYLHPSGDYRINIDHQGYLSVGADFNIGDSQFVLFEENQYGAAGLHGFPPAEPFSRAVIGSNFNGSIVGSVAQSFFGETIIDYPLSSGENSKYAGQISDDGRYLFAFSDVGGNGKRAFMDRYSLKTPYDCSDLLNATVLTQFPANEFVWSVFNKDGNIRISNEGGNIYSAYTLANPFQPGLGETQFRQANLNGTLSFFTPASTVFDFNKFGTVMVVCNGASGDVNIEFFSGAYDLIGFSGTPLVVSTGLTSVKSVGFMDDNSTIIAFDGEANYAYMPLATPGYPTAADAFVLPTTNNLKHLIGQNFIADPQVAYFTQPCSSKSHTVLATQNGATTVKLSTIKVGEGFTSTTGNPFIKIRE